MHITLDDLTRPEVHALLAEHLEDMRTITPHEHVHALDVSRLRTPDVSFYTAWDDDGLAGCGALKALSATHGEIKSMRTPAARRRRGAGRAMLLHLLAEARRRGYERVSLETGASEAFRAAHTLYESVGFTRCGPFGDYPASPHSVFMTLALRVTHSPH
jgi:putative acetyltransferase